LRHFSVHYLFSLLLFCVNFSYQKSVVFSRLSWRFLILAFLFFIFYPVPVSPTIPSFSSPTQFYTQWLGSAVRIILPVFVKLVVRLKTADSCLLVCWGGVHLVHLVLIVSYVSFGPRLLRFYFLPGGPLCSASPRATSNRPSWNAFIYPTSFGFHWSPSPRGAVAWSSFCLKKLLSLGSSGSGEFFGEIS
jgi:hypothetical protein